MFINAKLIKLYPIWQIRVPKMPILQHLYQLRIIHCNIII